MPTVIDELIVRLSLDSTQFDEGDQRLVASLRRMETRASGSARQITETAGASTLQFFRTIESPYASVRKMFEQLATHAEQPQAQLRRLEDQGRRTGESVEGGALAGARGLRVLGAAGLGVFAAYEGLSRMISSANANAQRLFGSGVGAAAAGMGINQFTAISQALFRAGNVPQEQTQATLGSWRSAQIGLLRGDQASAGQLAAFTTALAQARANGLNVNIDPYTDTPEQIMDKLSAGFAGMNADAAQSVGSSLGLTPEQVFGMRTAGRNLPNLTDAERQRAATAGQAAGAADLVTATNNLSNAWDHLSRVMNEVADGPLAKIINLLADFIDNVAGAGSPDAINALVSPGSGGEGEVSAGTPGNRWWNRLYNWATGNKGASDGGGGNSAFSWNGGGARARSLTTRGDFSAAADIAAVARAGGANDSAITAMFAGALGEGGLGATTGTGDVSLGGSYGHWQLFSKGELPKFLAQGGKIGDTASETRYVLKRLNEIMPGFSTSTDREAQIQAIKKFESSQEGNASNGGYYAQNWDLAKRILGGGVGIAPAGAGPLALGDSIAVGLAGTGLSEPYIPGYRTTAAQRADTSQFAVSGRTTADVLNMIRANAAAIKGRRVLLSSGASNDVGEAGTGTVDYAAIAQQVDAIRAAGGTPVLLGVGQGLPGSATVNRELAKIAAAHGVPFGGELLTSEGRVHPRDYAANLTADLAYLQKDKASAGAGGSSMTNNGGDVNVNGDIVVRAPTREGGAIGDAVVDRINRVSLAINANSGLTQ